MAPIEVRDVRGPAELRACQALQRAAWGIVEDGYVVPVATMVSVQKVGGLVLGAFESERLVGFSFAFLGRFRGQLVLYSQLTAVLPDLQGRGVGRALKLEQRRRAAGMGLERTVWAFDPLQASNAFFNLAVLGATSRTYEVDLYGARTDRLNAGLATDRLLVEWATTGDRAGLDDRWPDGVELIQTALIADGHPRQPTRNAPTGGASHLHAEIPADLSAVKAADQGLALAWQEAVRAALQSAFAEGYVAVGFARGAQPCYLLERPA
ncbi:MAG: GNAT family N-acetyltransferase [Chloroflexi bacterium]|nr:GNAT family N-acetyltransferase [Chloroflexota bacterium]